MYDKEASVLRVETTIVRPEEFRIDRAKEGRPKGQKRCRTLRKGVCDMYRRGQVCRAANQRYLEALASVTGSNSLLQEAALSDWTDEYRVKVMKHLWKVSRKAWPKPMRRPEL
jgi:hypothetical protein